MANYYVTRTDNRMAIMRFTQQMLMVACAENRMYLGDFSYCSQAGCASAINCCYPALISF